MNPTDTGNPDYYHKVVDCQWACPAHTNVPEYIRLIAQGRYTDAYMLNRESNVFPGILGRTCDRPCEPACRRGRLDGKPVAICRLKRVAADLRDDISDLLPPIPAKKNGKRIACIGAGPASLTVANDLMPHGYEVTIFEKTPSARRPDAHQHSRVPSARKGVHRRDRLHPQYGRRNSLQLAGRKHARSARRRVSTPSSSAAARRAARISSFPAATIRIAFISASTGWARWHSATSIRSASAC